MIEFLSNDSSFFEIPEFLWFISAIMIFCIGGIGLILSISKGIIGILLSIELSILASILLFLGGDSLHCTSEGQVMSLLVLMTSACHIMIMLGLFNANAKWAGPDTLK